MALLNDNHEVFVMFRRSFDVFGDSFLPVAFLFHELLEVVNSSLSFKHLFCDGANCVHFISEEWAKTSFSIHYRQARIASFIFELSILSIIFLTHFRSTTFYLIMARCIPRRLWARYLQKYLLTLFKWMLSNKSLT